jgi:hypothetical protein
MSVSAVVIGQGDGLRRVDAALIGRDERHELAGGSRARVDEELRALGANILGWGRRMRWPSSPGLRTSGSALQGLRPRTW